MKKKTPLPSIECLEERVVPSSPAVLTPQQLLAREEATKKAFYAILVGPTGHNSLRGEY